MSRSLSQHFKKTLATVAGPFVHYARKRAHPDIPLDHKIVNLQYGEKKVALRQRRWSLSDSLAIQQCFADAQYNMPDGAQGKSIQRVYDGIVQSGRTPLILDCGANIGASVAWFAHRYPEAHIIAVEPSEENCALLRWNTRGMSVDVRQAAVAATDGTAFLINQRSGEAMGFQVVEESRGEPVPTLSIPTLLSTPFATPLEPFLLKIDIEGGEKNLFSGDTAAMDAFPLIIMEPHDWMCPGEGTSLSFFRFHAQSGREFSMKHENIASIRVN